MTENWFDQLRGEEVIWPHGPQGDTVQRMRALWKKLEPGTDDYATMMAVSVVLCEAAAEIETLRGSYLERNESASRAWREVERLNALINNAHTDCFLESVRTEAAHQRERWASEHDGGKADSDWFWLIGYLAGKALNKPEKRLHHIITTAAACLNWHRARSGEPITMRPGIAPPGEPS